MIPPEGALVMVYEDARGTFVAKCVECDRVLALGPSFDDMKAWAQRHAEVDHDVATVGPTIDLDELAALDSTELVDSIKAVAAALARELSHRSRILEEWTERMLTDPRGFGVLVEYCAAEGTMTVCLDESVPFGTLVEVVCTDHTNGSTT